MEEELVNDFENDDKEKQEEVHVLTRSGRVCDPVPPQQPAQDPSPLLKEDNSIVKQLKRTKAEMNIWQLSMTSKDHREALLKALTEINVPSGTSPESLVNFIAGDRSRPCIAFTDDDLPPEGSSHNKSLNINVVCKQLNIPMTLIDNGSAINVCPLRTAQRLGISLEELQPSTQVIRAYDNTRRQALGVTWLDITAGPVKGKFMFHVMEAKTSFNLLLGRPWLHKLGAVPSSYHQKIKLMLQDNPVTIDASSMKIQLIEKPIINVEHDEDDEDLWGFTVSMIEEDKIPFDFNPHSNLMVNAILRKQGYFPGLSLGLNKTKASPFIVPELKDDKFGLGYRPTKEERREQVQKYVSLRKNKDEFDIRPYALTLNGYFMRGGEEIPAYDFPEPFITDDGTRYPGLEVFHDCNFIDDDKTVGLIKGSLPSLDPQALGLLFGMEKESDEEARIQQVMGQETFDPSKMIKPVDDLIHGWRKTVKITTPDGRKFHFTTGEGPMFENSESEECIEFELESDSEVNSSPSESSLKESSSVSPPLSVAFLVSDKAAFDVMISEFNETFLSAYSPSPSPSLDCFNSHLTNDDELIKALEQHEQKTSIIETTEEINISNNDDDPKILHIGLTLNPQEREQLI